MLSWFSQRFSFIARGIGLMTRREIIITVGIIGLMMIGGLFESAILALVVPLVYIIIDPSKLAGSSIGRRIASLFGSDLSSMFPYLAFTLIILIVVSNAIMMFSLYAAEAHSSKSRARLVADLLRRCVDAPYVWTLQTNTGVLSRRINDDTKAWYREFIHSMMMIVQALIMIIAPATVAVAIAPAEGFSALGVVAAICASIVILFRRRMRSHAIAMRQALDRIAKNLLQILSGVRDIKISGQSAFFIDRFLREYVEGNRLSTITRMWSMAPSSIINALGQIGFLLTAFIFWYRGNSGTEIIAQLALIGVVVSRVLPAFNRLAAQFAILFHSLPFVESLFQLKDTINRAIENYGRRSSGRTIPENWRTLALENVSFRYPKADGQSLVDISMSLKRGHFYGFVGRSGAGKSTLVNTLLGLIEPTHGSVRLDGVPITTLSLTEWQSRFGYVPQDPFILDASMRENIAFGTPGDDHRIQSVLKRVKLDALVTAAPDGLDMQLGERGRQISGGQCQRVAIARALYKDCQVLLLDEATSALDSITESEVYETLEGMRGEVLALMIAHRVTSLRGCEKIFVLDAGHVVDAGTYSELLSRSVVFRALAAETDTAAPIAV